MERPRSLCLLAILLAVTVSMTGRTITPAQALQRLEDAPGSSTLMKVRPSITLITLSHTFMDSLETKPLVYVFNKGFHDGYLVLPADDQCPPLLGFGDSGRFSIKNVPPAMKSFLEDYAREVEYVTTHDHATAAAVAADRREPIAPLLTCTWNQDAPYNGMCPTLDFIDTGSGKPTGEKRETVTGCVATSMAQVMYYHRWPAKGSGEHSYSWQRYLNVAAKELSCDFGAITFDWDNMLDHYTEGNYTEEQARAVAQLMYACGISVDMNYSSADLGGSGAVSNEQGPALVNYFGYSRAVRYRYRDLCSSTEFENIIYDNLSRGLPVLYNGRGSGGGHSFVCDGYAGNHFFHFNWGWGGNSDGYFYLARLDPNSPGIGGGTGGFNSNQGISYNIIPLRDGVDTGTDELPYIATDGNFDFAQDKDGTVSFDVTDEWGTGPYYNASSARFYGHLGVSAEPRDEALPTRQFFATPLSLYPGYGRRRMTLKMSGLKPGSYRVRPIYNDTVNHVTDYMRIPNGYRKYVNLTVAADGAMTFSNSVRSDDAASAPPLGVNGFGYDGKVHSGQTKSYLITMSNFSDSEDYYGNLTMVLRDNAGAELETYPLGSFSTPADQTLSTASGIVLNRDPGNYKVTFRDAYERDLPGEFPVTVLDAQEPLPTGLRAVTFTPTDVLPGTGLPTLTVRVVNTGSEAVTASTFALDIYKAGTAPGKNPWTVSFGSLTFNAGKGLNLTVEGVEEPMENGCDYNVDIYCYPDGSDTPVLISRDIVIHAGYPLESVSIDGDSEVLIGWDWERKLNVSVTPENAILRSLTWTSSDPSVVSVDNDGVIRGRGVRGNAYVTATAHNGASSHVYVTVANPTGTDDIRVGGADAEILAVYTLSGVKIMDKPSDEALRSLPAGIYVVSSAGGTRKLQKKL